MGPRSQISGELPIDSYFNSAGTVRRKDGSMKRRTGADADDANRTRTKKQRTKEPSKGANLEAQEKSRSRSADVRPKAVTGVFATTSIPTPISLAKLPRSASSQVHTDMEVITITSSSPPREIVLGPGDALRTARNAASVSSLPTPQTVSHEAKRNRTAVAAAPPRVPTASRSVLNSGPAISSFPRPPLTPSRPRSKPGHIPLVHRTTPHSQRIVPSSQWSDDEQSNSASTSEANRDPFLLRRTEESDSCLDDMTLPPPSDVFPSSPNFSTSSLTPAKSRISGYPTFTGLVSVQRRSLENNLDNGNSGNTRTNPMSLSGSSRSVLLSSSGFGRSQSSQIEPTSQMDEIELKFSSQRLFATPILSPQTNQCDMVPSIERSQTGPLRTPHSEVIVEQESSSTNHCCEPSPPPSPLTPLSSTSSLLSHSEMDTMGVNRSPLHHASRETSESPAPRSSPQFMVDLEIRGTAQHLTETVILTEDPPSREDENSLVHRFPDRRPSPPANVQNTISPTGDCPSPGTHSHPRISHAKLRSLPDPAIELDSEGEEMSPTSSFSIPATSQEMTTSYSASSCLDLIGTLPSEVGDFLDMVDAYAFSQP